MIGILRAGYTSYVSEITERDVVRLDPQAKSVWLADGRRIGFAAARRFGIDVEDIMERKGTGPFLRQV